MNCAEKIPIEKKDAQRPAVGGRGRGQVGNRNEHIRLVVPLNEWGRVYRSSIKGRAISTPSRLLPGGHMSVLMQVRA